MSRKHAKKAANAPTAEKAEALEQINDAEVLDAVEASGAIPERPVVDPEEDKSGKLSAELAGYVSHWATEIQEINLPRRLWGSRLYKDWVEVKGFKADLKLVYLFLLRLHEKATIWARARGKEDVPFTLAIPVGVIQRTFGLTEATTQRYLAMLGDGQSKKTGETFFGLVTWKKDCKGFHIVNIHDLRFKDVAGFELK